MGHFSVDSPLYDLQHGRGVKVLPYQSGQHQREQHLCKFFNGKLRCEGVSPDPGIIPQHRAQGIQNVLPGPMHLLLSIGGVLLAKFLNLFSKEKINPMIGAAGISAFPMSSRVIQKMAMQEDPGNVILMHAAGANVSGQIASVIAGGMVVGLVTRFL